MIGFCGSNINAWDSPSRPLMSSRSASPTLSKLQLVYQVICQLFAPGFTTIDSIHSSPFQTLGISRSRIAALNPILVLSSCQPIPAQHSKNALRPICSRAYPDWPRSERWLTSRSFAGSSLTRLFLARTLTSRTFGHSSGVNPMLIN
jgi:hypothetical protein